MNKPRVINGLREPLHGRCMITREFNLGSTGVTTDVCPSLARSKLAPPQRVGEESDDFPAESGIRDGIGIDRVMGRVPNRVSTSLRERAGVGNPGTLAVSSGSGHPKRRPTRAGIFLLLLCIVRPYLPPVSTGLLPTSLPDPQERSPARIAPISETHGIFFSGKVLQSSGHWCNCLFTSTILW
jgi:hypothetical protein